MGHTKKEIDAAFELNGGDRSDFDEVTPDEQTKMLAYLKQERLVLYIIVNILSVNCRDEVFSSTA